MDWPPLRTWHPHGTPNQQGSHGFNVAPRFTGCRGRPRDCWLMTLKRADFDPTLPPTYRFFSEKDMSRKWWIRPHPSTDLAILLRVGSALRVRMSGWGHRCLTFSQFGPTSRPRPARHLPYSRTSVPLPLSVPARTSSISATHTGHGIPCPACLALPSHPHHPIAVVPSPSSHHHRRHTHIVARRPLSPSPPSTEGPSMS